MSEIPPEIVDLSERPAEIPRVARWIFNEFWGDQEIVTEEWLVAQLGRATNPDKIPLSLLALRDGEPIGTINLIENDDDKRTHLRPWLAALLVLPNARSCGVGSALVRSLQRRAVAMGIETMYLGTDNPGFYEKLGARIHEQVRPEFCVMSIRTSAAGMARGPNTTPL